ncbi:malonyl-coenzyme A:anthocyanin 3-O-glucoside-6''-O-malonyltransferase-like [Vitis vinifera]|uniref:malonyl-coenzyme A:anthocyanin 3-O-glucoside-6''-O-malonyltransferase-like n=1 Tax=Vitis vinifera TaxID=29760 RepID=UPI002882DE64|nr:malonyl-coenzyme A:anthocyanin 3-O-glucoside-6''-O-malonyltransferase-like [Vitis vinifera]
MASSDEMVNVSEECRVSPPPNAVSEKSLPLTFFDLIWLHFHLAQSLFFYKFPHSKTQFIETPIPSLKHSLSLALRHFYPFEGNLLFPPNLREPEIHYVDGDSVSMTFAEFNRDFAYLIKNHQRKVAHFYPLLPQLPPVCVKRDTLVASVFQLWNFFWVHLREPLMLEGAILPFYDRTMVKDPNKLGSVFWQHHQKIKFEGYRPLLPTSNILAAILLSQVDLQRLKKGFGSMSNVVTCLKFYSSMCLHMGLHVKARACSGEEHAKSMQLIDEDGFIIAANLIGEAIQEKLGSNKGVLEGLDKWVVNFSSINIKRAVGVAGSPGFAVYGIDFGLGQLQKRESISIDETRCISLHEGKDNKGDIEVGLSFPKIKMNAFASIFTDGLMVYD